MKISHGTNSSNFNIPPALARLSGHFSAAMPAIKQIRQALLVPNNLAAFKVWIKAYRQELKRRAEDAFPFL